MSGQIDYGYPWWLSYGHLALLIPAALLMWLGYKRKWPRWPLILLGAVTLWLAAGLMVSRLVLNINGPAKLPTEHFLASGSGRVLDIGAGTGRSSIMVLQARPRVTLVALDEFGESYRHHFGAGLSPQERLTANLKAAGVDSRATIQTADMRSLPFEAASFDAIVSAYAIDHLNRAGIDKALSEAARVIKPQGEFLLMLVGKDPWVQFAFGPLLLHGGQRGAGWWSGVLEVAGFEVIEHGMRPATLYLLARKK